jgi:hypothetical protein
MNYLSFAVNFSSDIEAIEVESIGLFESESAAKNSLNNLMLLEKYYG